MALTAAACGSGHKTATKRPKGATTSSSVTTTIESTTSTALAGAGATAKPTATTGRSPSTGAPAGGGKPVSITLTRVASLSQPLAFAQAPNDSALYVAEKGGKVQAIRNGQVSTVMDISSQVSTGTEQGLLGLAFSPDRST